LGLKRLRRFSPRSFAFENNEIRIFDVKPYLDTGLFKALEDKKFFGMVKVSYDTIEWPNKADLDPEVLYEKSRVKKPFNGNIKTCYQ
jgi:hypothetical protein